MESSRSSQQGPKTLGHPGSKTSRWNAMSKINAYIAKVNDEIRRKSKEIGVPLKEVEPLSFNNVLKGWIVSNLDSHTWVQDLYIILNYGVQNPKTGEIRFYPIRHSLRPIGILTVFFSVPKYENGEITSWDDKYMVLVRENRFSLGNLIECPRGWGEDEKRLAINIIERKLPGYKEVTSQKPFVFQMGTGRYEDTSVETDVINKILVRIPITDDVDEEKLQEGLRSKYREAPDFDRIPYVYAFGDLVRRYYASLLRQGLDGEANTVPGTFDEKDGSRMDTMFDGDQTATPFERYLLWRMLVEKSLSSHDLLSIVGE